MALSPRTSFTVLQREDADGVAEVLAALDPSRLELLRKRFTETAVKGLCTAPMGKTCLVLSKFVEVVDSVLPSADVLLASQDDEDRIDSTGSLARRKPGSASRRRRDVVLTNDSRRAAALAMLFELCDPAGSGVVEMRDLEQLIADRVTNPPRFGPAEQRSSGGGAGDGGGGCEALDIAPYSLHKVVTTLAPNTPDTIRAATIAAATSSTSRLAADSLTRSLKHQLGVLQVCPSG
jgi:hypothetical protein